MAAERVFVGLGSNVGRRLVFLRRAVRALGRVPGVRVIRVSPVYETAPVGPRQRDFLNAAVELRFRGEPLALLGHLKSIEQNLGRRRRKRWGPREIDLDLIFFGQRRCCAALQLPHPRWKERKFVVWPLTDIAARFKDPTDGRSLAHTRQKLTGSDQSIRLYERSLR
ncbi:MAG: 2-amino-4-hydroxy-6-hydroxymethyldihydropteridine diphosphokinase [Elusimicrobia bacterium]|nr:2-amino-4-hydroxy-6-hydroxymethyldihydropteridine diphosphokinase [Elusimicrobiota bacterium]